MDAVTLRSEAGRPAPRGRLTDAVVAAGMLCGATVSLALSIVPGAAVPPPLVLAVWALALTVPLGWRRTAPTVSGVVVVVAFLGGQVVGVPEYLVSQIAPFLALYSIGAWSRDRRRALGVRAVLVAVIVVFFVIAVVRFGDGVRQGLQFVPGGAVVLSALMTMLYLTAAIAFGETTWRSATSRAALERRTAELHMERLRSERHAVAVERLRIARELHDVVAHRVSVIGVQAGAARRVLPTSPERASAALSAVEANARLAVGELRSTVLALRDPADEGHTSTAPVGLPQLLELIEEARVAGTTVDFAQEGDAARVAPLAGLALYRVAQEALTNVRKHAGDGASARVRLQIDDRRAELTVTDDGRVPATDPDRAGMGLVGMRERLDTVGGTLQAGAASVGFRVSAIVPMQP